MKKTNALAIIFLSWISLNGTISSANTAFNSNCKFNDNIQLVAGITEDDIIKYLQDRGYSVDSTPIQDYDNWTCYTSKGSEHYFTTVFTDGTSIIVHEDVRL